MVRHAASVVTHTATTAFATAAVRRAAPTQTAAAAVRNPNNLPVKTCTVCNRPFTWRKKWERCWDEVQTCSKRCKSERKRGGAGAIGAGGVDVDDDSDDQGAAVVVVGDPKATRRAANKARKADRRAGLGGQKPCDLCLRDVDTLIRCQVDSGSTWRLVCGRCWETPEVAGGVVDGCGANPHYRYGGLWKNRRKK